MAAHDLCWLTYLLTDLGERPRSPPVLYVDNKAMIALCLEQKLEHRTKDIALRYFLAQELHQRGQLRLTYVASRANTADVFTKALGSGDHQRFCTALGLVDGLADLLEATATPPSMGSRRSNSSGGRRGWTPTLDRGAVGGRLGGRRVWEIDLERSTSKALTW
ncbi:unnamed protein product [Closterium sp. NIES-53]